MLGLPRLALGGALLEGQRDAHPHRLGPGHLCPEMVAGEEAMPGGGGGWTRPLLEDPGRGLLARNWDQNPLERHPLMGGSGKFVLMQVKKGSFIKHYFYNFVSNLLQSNPASGGSVNDNQRPGVEAKEYYFKEKNVKLFKGCLKYFFSLLNSLRPFKFL